MHDEEIDPAATNQNGAKRRVMIVYNAAVSSEILALCDVDIADIKQYLTGKGETGATIEWKYFDSDFNKERDRGFVYLHNGKIAGFIGLIPFTASIDGQNLSAAWS